jgi:hypothetical protein
VGASGGGESTVKILLCGYQYNADIDIRTMIASSQHKKPREYRKHGIHTRDWRLRARGLAGIDGRTAEGREALAWRDHALKAKGGVSCPHHVKVEIRAATFDLWRLLHVQTYIIADANQRGTIVNRRRRELPRIHEQYAEIDHRFMRRCEALDLDKGGMDLARRLMMQQETALEGRLTASSARAKG